MHFKTISLYVSYAVGCRPTHIHIYIFAFLLFCIVLEPGARSHSRGTKSSWTHRFRACRAESQHNRRFPWVFTSGAQLRKCVDTQYLLCSTLDPGMCFTASTSASYTRFIVV